MTETKTTREPNDKPEIVLVFTKRCLGGTTTHADELATTLSERGFRCQVIFLYTQDEIELSFPHSECLRATPPKGPAAYISLFWSLVRRLSALRPEVVHACMPMASNLAPVAAQLAGVPIRTTAQHITADELRFSQRVLEAVHSKVGIVQKTICVSEAVRESFSDFPDSYKRKCVVIENAVPTPKRNCDHEFYNVQKLRDMGHLTVLCVGTLSERKNQSLLLRALSVTEGVALILAGDGPDRLKLEALAKQLGIENRCVFLGFLEKKLLSTLYYLTDVTALPSLREGMPLALLEAMASGTCVLASDIPPNRETIAGPDGQNLAECLLPVNDVQKWADAFAALHNDPDLRRTLAAHAKMRSNAFSPTKLVSRYCAVWSAAGAESTRQP